MKIAGSIALVTGANRGIGKAYAQELAKAGTKKVYLGVRKIESVADLVKTNPDVFIPLELDVTNHAQVESAANKASDVNILINNAGILFFDNPDPKTAIQDARAQMEVNYIGPMAMAHAFAPVLKKNGGGVLVTVSSIVGHMVFPGLVSYSASKFAAQGLILGLRLQLSANGTKVIGVYPGPIDTDMAKDVPMDKVPPSQVALETIKAIEDGNTEEVFPDAFAKDMYANVRKNPKAVEAQMLQMTQHSDAA